MHRKFRLASIVVLSCLLGSCASFSTNDPCEGLPPLYGTDC